MFTPDPLVEMISAFKSEEANGCVLLVEENYKSNFFDRWFTM